MQQCVYTLCQLWSHSLSNKTALMQHALAISELIKRNKCMTITAIYTALSQPNAIMH